MSSFDTTQVTLMYLANSVYQEEAAKAEKVSNKEKKEEEKFYRKRVFSMMKSMLKGKYESESLKEAHKSYVSTIIEHIKCQDRCELLQSEYSPKTSKNKSEKNITNPIFGLETIPEEADLSQADALLMSNKSSEKQPTLDDFVEIRKIKVKKEDPPPRIRNVNIKTEAHRIKGLQSKKPKKPKNDSDQTKST
jgi:hypothetical protein